MIMKWVANRARRFWRDERGATAIEYVLIAGIMAVVIIGLFATVGDDFEAGFAAISEALNP